MASLTVALVGIMRIWSTIVFAAFIWAISCKTRLVAEIIGDHAKAAYFATLLMVVMQTVRKLVDCQPQWIPPCFKGG